MIKFKIRVISHESIVKIGEFHMQFLSRYDPCIPARYMSVEIDLQICIATIFDR
jgi:hypothetical protein